MQTKQYTGTMPKDKARSEINGLVKDVKQELRKIAKQSTLDAMDVLELFVGNLLKRVGVLPAEKALKN